MSSFKHSYIGFALSLVLISALTILVSCNSTGTRSDVNTDLNTNVRTFNADNEVDLAEYERLNLDDTHPNMLNPEQAKSNFDAVVKSWKNLHVEVNTYLNENNFRWEVQDSNIAVVDKIYFDRDGNIKAYFFKVLNPQVSYEKKEAFSELLSDFSKTASIDYLNLTGKSYAQCGKIKYWNY
ncbi:hypothetical protein CLV84_0841 [Neolewinella xylanilytica]|uniref:Lipoprotein n=1 Tax=Neolewinella xylanilytica TaxID=1514080 RepID=A0A2S6I8Q8_9BACT|nr:hypothetical protein [Neolewinella xylanilytica]PPK87886.1 hypothetical protein CLV84_0841 [Neolewinella xylanilytica]